jgi:phage tail-like protein
MQEIPTYRYLNLEFAWPLFQLNGIEIGRSGELRLAELPRLDSNVGDPLEIVETFEGPAGISVDSAGDLYFVDPARHRILRMNPCDGSVEPVPCIGGQGSDPGQLDSPHGLLVGRGGVLYVADTGNRRVQAFDLRTMQVRGLWDRGFQQPWDLAEDSAGRVYVADPGTQDATGAWHGGRVSRLLEASGREQAWTLTGVSPGAPTGLVITQADPDAPTTERLLVLDRQPPALLVYRLDGSHDEAATAGWKAAASRLQLPSALRATAAGALYVADQGSGQVLAFSAKGAFLGTASGLDAGAAGLALDCDGRLIAHPGRGGALRRALGLPGYVTCGTFLAGPYTADTEPTRWQQLQVELDSIPDGAHFQLWTLTTNDATSPVPPVSCSAPLPSIGLEADATRPAALQEWRAAATDAPDALILNEPGSYLWIAGVFHGDGAGTPVLRQIRLSHDAEGWLRHLPGLFSRDDTSHRFLERALALFQVLYDQELGLVQELPRLFDPEAAPDGSSAPWLEWLADWVGAELDESWAADKRRSTVARAFEVFGRRGTRESLRYLISLYTGATVFIEEAASGPGLWGLDSPSSALGVDSMLAPALPEGAVLGSTALVNRSTLESQDPHGRPAFEQLAHQFSVQVLATGLSDFDALDRVRQVIDREKPAHTKYHLCTIEARMRVGLQARLGIDALVGGPPRRGAFDRDQRLGEDSVLPGDSAPRRFGLPVGEPEQPGFPLTVG